MALLSCSLKEFYHFLVLLSNLFTGWLYDTTGNFYMSFITLAAFEVSAAVMILVKPTHLGKYCKRQSRNTTPDVDELA